jgi:hypothetical protein
MTKPSSASPQSTVGVGSTIVTSAAFKKRIKVMDVLQIASRGKTFSQTQRHGKNRHGKNSRQERPSSCDGT